MKKVKQRSVYREIIKNINSLKTCSRKPYEIIGIIYTLSSVVVMNQLSSSELFADFSRDAGDIGFSRKYLSKRMIMFFRFLGNFKNRMRYEDEQALVDIKLGELEQNLIHLELNGKIDGLRRNGYGGMISLAKNSSFDYIGLGMSVEGMIRSERSLNQNI